jgi:hypothetical protein
MKRTTSRILFLVVVEQTSDDAPSSSSFPAASTVPEAKPTRDAKPLAKTSLTSAERFPWAKKVGGS